MQSGGNMLDHAVVYPPNGVVPFHGFALFCAPFCYVYSGKSTPPSSYLSQGQRTAVKKAPVFSKFSKYVSLSDPCQLYFTFRAFYLQFCSKLHEVSSDRQGILSLCALFENLVSFDM